MIDSFDKIRLEIVKLEISEMLNSLRQNSNLKGVLFLANKMDLVNSYDAVTIGEKLELAKIFDELPELSRVLWCIHGTNALTGQGVPEGMDWLINLRIDE